MRIALTPEQEALRSQLRAYFNELVTPERRSALSGATGDFGEMGGPKEWGGQDRSMVEQLIFTDVAAVAGVPIPYLTLNTIGPTIMQYGTDEQKEYFLPRILRGELHFSVGYSEPGSGTDLASLQTKAVLDEAAGEAGEWVINGQKMWTSLIQYADWIWLACRTEADRPRHQGISMILVPAHDPGAPRRPTTPTSGSRPRTWSAGAAGAGG
jgi:alkylation response protein AidB-like acyl-CoA dehydrogenase